MNDTILVIHYHSGIVTYIPKDKTALDQDMSVHRLSEETQGAYADLCEAREAITSS